MRLKGWCWMKIKLMWMFNILAHLCLIAGLIAGMYSRCAYWVLMGCWAVFIVCNIVCCIIVGRDIKRLREITNDWWDEMQRSYGDNTQEEKEE